MNPLGRRMGIVLGAAIVVAVVLVVRHKPRAPAVPESEVTEIAPPPVPPSAPDQATRKARARPPVAPAPPASKPADDEATATARARDVLRSDPERALGLLDAADQAHPGGALAEERAAMRVDALVAARRIGPARDAAEVYLARYPRGPQAQRIEMLTGVHPRPSEPD